jgi:hypothetical protein
MSLITNAPEGNIWNSICKGFKLQRPPFCDDDASSVATLVEDFDPSKHTPVFCGYKMHKRIHIDPPAVQDFEPAISHPACVGYAFVEKPEKPPPPVFMIPDKNKCTDAEYLQYYIFPTLLPALEEMLRQAKLEKCLERKRTKFNSIDFVTEYLYRFNPNKCGREDTTLCDIPFVKAWWNVHPRPPLPKSLLWSEAEASLIVQSFWRGYQVRMEEDVQELRQWQREWRDENVKEAIEQFWENSIPFECEVPEPVLVPTNEYIATVNNMEECPPPDKSTSASLPETSKTPPSIVLPAEDGEEEEVEEEVLIPPVESCASKIENLIQAAEVV